MVGNKLFQAHEPRTLGVARIIVLLLLAGGLVTLGYFELSRIITPSIAYRHDTEVNGVSVPSIILFGDRSVLSDAHITLLRTWPSDTRLSNATDQLAINKEQVNGTHGIMIIHIRPNASIFFYPAKALTEYENSVATTIQLQFQSGSNSSAIAANGTRSSTISLALLSTDYALSNDALTEIDELEGVEPHLIQRVTLGTNYAVRLREHITVALNGQRQKDYNVGLDMSDAAASSTTMQLTLQPAHQSTADGNAFSIPLRIAEPTHSWLDMISLMGSAITFAVLFYTFLFGFSRLRPWGVIQRYLLRGHMLARLPSGVTWVPVTESSMFGANNGNGKDQNNSKTMHEANSALLRTRSSDSGIGTDVRQHTAIVPQAARVAQRQRAMSFGSPVMNVDLRRHAYRLSDPDFDQPPPWTGGTPDTPRDIALIHRLEWIEGRWRETRTDHLLHIAALADRLSELEAFQRRVEIFYHDTDLFNGNKNETTS
jgi:hypothetical protein